MAIITKGHRKSNGGQGTVAPAMPKPGRIIRAPKSESIVIPVLDIRHFILVLVGDTPYISHQWSEKQRKRLRGKVTGEAPAPREARLPAEEFEATIYRLPDGRPGIPSIAFKLSAVDAASQITGLTKVIVRAAFHVLGEAGHDLVAIEAPKPTMREDVARVGMGTEPRFRAEFWPWKVKIHIRHNAAVMSPAQIANLFNHAGFGVGVGDWRTAKDGNHGMFHVAGSED